MHSRLALRMYYIVLQHSGERHSFFLEKPSLYDHQLTQQTEKAGAKNSPRSLLVCLHLANNKEKAVLVVFKTLLLHKHFPSWHSSDQNASLAVMKVDRLCCYNTLEHLVVLYYYYRYSKCVSIPRSHS